MNEPRPYDAVLGGSNPNPQPQPYDAVLGGSNPNRKLTNEEELKLKIMLDPKLEPLVAHALASLVSAAYKTLHSPLDKATEKHDR